jgi:hypothetical protein
MCIRARSGQATTAGPTRRGRVAHRDARVVVGGETQRSPQ